MSPGDQQLSSPEVEFVTSATATAARRAVLAGKARRIRRGLVTTNTTDPLEVVVARNWPTIVAGYFPGSVLVDRTAFTGGRSAADGAVYVDQGPGGTVSRSIEMPGLRIVPRRGVGPADGDVPYQAGLFFSSQPRAFLDNLRPSRSGARSGRRTAARTEVEERLLKLRTNHGDEALNDLRDRARSLAPSLGAERESATLSAIIGAILGTQDVDLQSESARASRAGRAFDKDRDRITLFQRLAEELLATAPTRSLSMSGDPAVFAFFEAYFSNYIEGTEVTVADAQEIVFGDRVPPHRPQVAHDITSTFRLVLDADRAGVPSASATPSTVEEFLDLLLARHRVLMKGRNDKLPGRWKVRDNRAGATTFVSVDQVLGTLDRAFEIYQGLPAGFARAAIMMFAVAEVHPFTDGNGRIARMMANAELSASSECRLVIPTGYRENYLSALGAHAQPEPSAGGSHACLGAAVHRRRAVEDRGRCHALARRGRSIRRSPGCAADAEPRPVGSLIVRLAPSALPSGRRGSGRSRGRR